MTPTTAARAERLRHWALPFLVAGVATTLLLVFRPALGDLQAAIAREQAARSGVGLGYWFSWFGGVSPGSYSLIVPKLSAAIGSLPLLAIATMAIALLAYPLARDAVRPQLFTWAIAMAAVFNMMSGRVAFAVGAVIAIGALVVVQRGHTTWAGVLMVFSGLASPLAPSFVGMAGVAFLLAHPRSVKVWTVLIGSGLGVAVPFILFGAPGAQGFPWTTLAWNLAIAAGAGVALTERPQRWITPIAVVAALVIFAVPNGVGSNISRFFCLVLPCVVVYYSRTAIPILVIALAPAVSYAGFVAVADQVAVADAGDTKQDYDPLKKVLLQAPKLINHRVELIDARTHAGSHELGPVISLARGWENQSDSRFNPIFYLKDALTPESYRAWLDENAVSYVAVATEPLRQAKPEAALVNTGLSYLRKTWSNKDWTVYEVDRPQPIVGSPLRLLAQDPAQMIVRVPDTNAHPIQIRPNRYLVARNLYDRQQLGCITETPEGWITLQVDAPGDYALEGVLTVRGVLSEQPATCSSTG
ncbi:hypothetical protein [Williamsia sp. CHRR-6]|uniref:hypothetical protein n=1 Tax=Williamsia sp. CHRR-6 TaxID=2835871 RepID=UPI001BDB16C5|nr:hypothetical protein [Williamsia sp. CHRR-6]MBT0567554.1 hypothetical protein [Williamsia sp. CHRR-6]